MRRYSAGLGKLALALFDRHGRLQEKFKTHAINKGSGVFQEELDYGDILFIEHISTADGKKNVETGSTLIAALLTHVHSRYQPAQHPPFAFALPGPGEETVQGTVSFFRSVAFRRVGSSKYFCAAFDLSHSCNTLQPTDGFDTPSVTLKTSRVPDQDGNTIMHIAAVSGDLEALKGMEEEEVYSELSDIRNNNNNTPLEVLYEYLEDIRSGRLTSHPNLCQSDEFQGSEDRHAHSFAFLEELDTPEGLARLKGGADCRQYFNIGGSVYKVADAVFKEVVKNDDMVGDGEHRRASGDERAKLPKCRSDKEFRSAMIRCGFECSF
jgi:hypothetical protein